MASGALGAGAGPRIGAAVLLALLAAACGGEEETVAPRDEVPERLSTPDPAPPPRASDEEILRAATALLASCTDRSKRLVMEEDWAAMRKGEHVFVDLRDAPSDPDRGWDRMLVPLDREEIEVYVAEKDTYFSAHISGDSALREALQKLAGR
jgi:hypothetical protein